MSDFDDASLVLIPSGYKNGKVYSVKPTDGTGDLTFTRASSATRVQSDGLIEKVRTNLALYSEDQTNWTVQNQTNVTANAAANPLNGAVTADKVIPTVVTDDHYRGLTMATMVGEITASIYVKADGYSFFDFGIFSNTASNYPVRAIFNLSTQAITYVNGSVASITSVGSGWYRVSITGSVASSSSIGLYHRVKASATTGTYSGDNTSGMLLWGCQLESGVMTDYIGPTTTAAVSVGPVSGLPRLDYLGSTCGRLLLEPQRSNLVTYSEQIDNAAWSKTNCTITANAVTSPDGYQNADNIVTTSAASDVGCLAATVAADTTAYTQSGFFKWVSGHEQMLFRVALAGGTGIAKFLVFNVRTGVAVSSDTTYKIENYGNGWYRVSISITNNGTNTSLIFQNYPNNNTTQSQTISAWGLQMEAGAYATSYIPTLGASVTRVADDTSKTGISSLIGQTNGTFFVDVTFGNSRNSWFFSLVSNSWLNDSFYLEAFGASNYIAVSTVKNSASAGGALTTFVAAAGVRAKIAVQYTSTTLNLFINGVKYTGTRTAIPACTGLYLNQIGTFGASDSQYNSNRFNQVLTFTSALTDAQCIELTTL